MRLDPNHEKDVAELPVTAQMALAREVATRLLPARHIVRIDPALGPEQAKAIGLDVSTTAAKETLQALAEREVIKLDPLVKKQFLGHVPGPL